MHYNYVISGREDISETLFGQKQMVTKLEVNYDFYSKPLVNTCVATIHD